MTLDLSLALTPAVSPFAARRARRHLTLADQFIEAVIAWHVAGRPDAVRTDEVSPLALARVVAAAARLQRALRRRGASDVEAALGARLRLAADALRSLSGVWGGRRVRGLAGLASELNRLHVAAPVQIWQSDLGYAQLAFGLRRRLVHTTLV